MGGTYMALSLKEMIELTPKPELYNWIPMESETYYKYENDVVVAEYDKVGMKESQLYFFYILKNHYRDRMPDIIQHLNYFTTFYDLNKATYLATLSAKYSIDMNPNMAEKSFHDLVIDRIITNDFIAKCKMMANDLYNIDIDSDREGKFKNIPKITNPQAKMIVSLSFAFRFILPLCIHYSNIGTIFKNKSKTYYLECFDKIFYDIIRLFEKKDIKVYTALCKFIDSRVKKSYNNNRVIYYQKKQLRGDSPELYSHELIHSVIIVKSLYKLDYRKSCVSFIDGIIHHYNKNYARENYSSKPYEIDSPDSGSDSDDYLSRSEVLEMQTYNVDESNALISDVNTRSVVKNIRNRYKAIEISEEELNFYIERCTLNPITEFFIHSYYSKEFHDSYAIYNLSKETTILLLVYLKKIFQLKCLPILSQIVTAKITSKYKESIIKNVKFIEEMSNSNIYNQIISKKFRYIKELDPKEDPILKTLSTIINCTFEFIDIDPNINGYILSNVEPNDIKSEFLTFLSDI
jgi:hypothetical protein